jgi:hypothetical protein
MMDKTIPNSPTTPRGAISEIQSAMQNKKMPMVVFAS